jgi:hypothetical protein
MRDHKLLCLAATWFFVVIAMPAMWAQALTDADRALVRTWLLADCGLGENLSLEQKLTSRGAILEAPFLEALEKGPPAEEIAPVERLARERFDKRQKSLDDPNRQIEMSPADREAYRSITVDGFVSSEKESFTLRWRTQAIAGLALVGGDKARQALRAVERDRSSPLRESAAAAVKRLSAR